MLVLHTDRNMSKLMGKCLYTDIDGVLRKDDDLRDLSLDKVRKSLLFLVVVIFMLVKERRERLII